MTLMTFIISFLAFMAGLWIGYRKGYSDAEYGGFQDERRDNGK